MGTLIPYKDLLDQGFTKKNNHNNKNKLMTIWDPTVTASTPRLKLNCPELIGNSHIVNVKFEARIQSKQFLLSSPGQARPLANLLLKLRSCMVGPISKASLSCLSAKLNAVSPKRELFIQPTCSSLKTTTTITDVSPSFAPIFP